MSHWEIFIQFMEENPEFAKVQLIGASGKQNQKKLWTQLTTILNSQGLGQKPVQKWQKTWADYKYNLKRKAAALKREQNSTGGGPPEATPLNDLEERALKVFGNAFFEGIGVEELGIQSQTPKRKIRDIAQENLIIEQNNAAKNLAEEISNVKMFKGNGNNDQAGPSSDHTYMRTEKGKKRIRYTVNSEYELCKESVEILKDIKNTLNEGFATIANVLTDLNQSLKNLKK